ncbi:MAG: M24 family metallopeptidase, partial [Firmicutes bacterium]|nr:M24 family metallopeptidase [Bacillota bacterium]
MITIKSASDIEKMDAAGRIVEETLNLMGEMVRAGISTSELDHEAEAFIRSKGAVPSFLNYSGYPRSICTSVNEQVVHGIPGHYRLKDGDIVSVDVGAVINGFHGDAARTFLIGNVPDEVFCTKDVQITCKSDLFPYSEDNTERSKRSRRFSDGCEDFYPQEDGTYTYNDYLNF